MAEFSWWSVVPTLVGGGISILTAVLMFGIGQATERRKRKEEKKKSDALDAFIGLQKLMRTLEATENLARHIDRQFIEAHKSGDDLNDPASIVKPILGAPIMIEDLTAQEVLFLVRGNEDLMSKIWEIQQRARNNDVIRSEYNRLRFAFDDFLESSAKEIRLLEGSRISASCGPSDVVRMEMRLGRLNQVIVPLVETLEKDRAAIPEVINKYIVAAREVYGDHFPVTGVEKIGRGKNAHT